MKKRKRNPKLTAAQRIRRTRQTYKRKARAHAEAAKPTEFFAPIVGLLCDPPEWLHAGSGIRKLRRGAEDLDAQTYTLTRPGPFDPFADWPVKTDWMPEIPSPLRAPAKDLVNLHEETCDPSDLIKLRNGHTISVGKIAGDFSDGTYRMLWRCETKGLPQAAGEWSLVYREEIEGCLPDRAPISGQLRMRVVGWFCSIGSGVIFQRELERRA